jgi:CheY-like chemotaxis protein
MAALAGTRVRIEFADTTEEALQILSTGKDARRLPNLILLAWQAESRGAELLQAIKSDYDLRATPVVVFRQDITPDDARVIYDHQANCLIEEPNLPEHRKRMLRMVGEFWFRMAELPGSESLRYLSSSK